MNTRCLPFVFLAAAVAPAQAVLTTTFANNNGGAVGGAVYFDLDVTDPSGITITGLDLNLTGSGSVEFYITPGTRTGVQTVPSAWSLISSGAVAGAVPGAPSSVAIGAVPLAFGSYGIAFVGIGVSHSYTNGSGSNQTYTAPGLSLLAGEALNVAFSGSLFSPRVVNTNIYYSNGTNGTIGSNTTLGEGCVRGFASAYESFATAAAFDLNNTYVTMYPGMPGYVVVPAGGFLPSGSISASQVLSLTDDSEVTVPLTAMGTFPADGGAVSALTVCSNGFVSVASGNGSPYSPSVASMLAAPRMAWWCWHDFNPSSSGAVEFMQNASVSVVTWNNVRNYGGNSPADDSTFQMQFFATGEVGIAWQTMAATGNGYLVGYSPGGPSLDPDSTDMSVELQQAGAFVIDGADAIPLALAATSRPVIGNSWNFLVTEIPANGVIGVMILGATDLGLNELGFLGLPGCGMRAGIDLVFPFSVAGPTYSHALLIPNIPSYVGWNLYMSAAVFQAPAVNAFGAITANAIEGLIGDL